MAVRGVTEKGQRIFYKIQKKKIKSCVEGGKEAVHYPNHVFI